MVGYMINMSYSWLYHVISPIIYPVCHHYWWLNPHEPGGVRTIPCNLTMEHLIQGSAPRLCLLVYDIL